MREYKVKEQLLQATLNYLKTKPYDEVYALISTLMSCKPVEEIKKPEEE